MPTPKPRGRPKKVVVVNGTSLKIIRAQAFKGKSVVNIPVEQSVDQWHLSLVIGNQTYEGKGETMLEALQSLPKPPKMVIKGAFTVTHGKRQRVLAYTPYQIKRLFWPIATKVIAKQLAFGL